MIREINTGRDVSVLDRELTGGLGRFTFYHPVGTFSLTPASNILIEAIIRNQKLIHGTGLDWGSGVGCLAILAARIAAVYKLYGLEISEENIRVARRNAVENHVSEKTSFLLADSYVPYKEEDRQVVKALRGKVDFILANPPSSDWDDGFGYRRIVMEGAKEYLKKDGIVLLNISFQYGSKRRESLYKDIDGFSYLGVTASSDWVPFDLGRPDLLDCLKVYAQEEQNGGAEYIFRKGKVNEDFINAQVALDNYDKTGISPYTKWQTHLFKYTA